MKGERKGLLQMDLKRKAPGPHVCKKGPGERDEIYISASAGEKHKRGERGGGGEENRNSINLAEVS